MYTEDTLTRLLNAQKETHNALLEKQKAESKLDVMMTRIEQIEARLLARDQEEEEMEEEMEEEQPKPNPFLEFIGAIPPPLLQIVVDKFMPTNAPK